MHISFWTQSVKKKLKKTRNRVEQICQSTAYPHCALMAILVYFLSALNYELVVLIAVLCQSPTKVLTIRMNKSLKGIISMNRFKRFVSLEWRWILTRSKIPSSFQAALDMSPSPRRFWCMYNTRLVQAPNKSAAPLMCFGTFGFKDICKVQML